MKNVEIIVSGTGYEDYYQAYVTIYDECNNIVFEGYTYNGSICFKAIPNNFYRINVDYFRGQICKYFYVSNDLDYPIVINKYVPKKKNPLITFNLTDQNYEGLKIERGNINLWQNHIM